MKTYPWKEIAKFEIDKISPLFKEYNWEDKSAYADFISNMYYFLAQACRLLAASASKCGTDMDPFYHRFIEHAGEEKNHEKLVLADLKNLKEELRPCSPAMPAIWQTQFYLIQNKSPLALFGCILYLENLSLAENIGPLAFNRTRKAFGDKCTNYLRVHVQEDGDHVEKLYAALNELPVDQSPIVLESFKTTASLYYNFVRELGDKHLGSEKTKAA